MNEPRPRLGFLGVGWIGVSRLSAIARSGCAEIAAVADPSPDAIARTRDVAPQAAIAGDLREMLELAPDGVVIATPSAQHAEQALRAIEHGCAVFCQKPLGRSRHETSRVIEAARARDRLLAVDLSYRFTEAMRGIHALIRGGELGDVYAVTLVFHNAYGPDKPWFYERASSGGGALIDLGTHLLDLALWALDFPRVASVDAQLFASGRPLAGMSDQVEDHAIAQLVLESGAALQLACSWKLHAGCDCVIDVAFHGTRGGARFRSVKGSFYDFEAELARGTTRKLLAGPPDDWSGRAAVAWAEQLGRNAAFDPAALRLLDLADTVDRIYAAARVEPAS
jgi:predicted dehydrogenase